MWNILSVGKTRNVQFTVPKDSRLGPALDALMSQFSGLPPAVVWRKVFELGMPRLAADPNLIREDTTPTVEAMTVAPSASDLRRTPVMNEDEDPSKATMAQAEAEGRITRRKGAKVTVDPLMKEPSDAQAREARRAAGSDEKGRKPRGSSPS